MNKTDPHNRLRRSSTGIILIEVLMSVLILGIVLTVIIRAYTTSLRASAYVADYTPAMILARDKMEQIRDRLAAGEAGDLGEESGQFDAPYRHIRYTTRLEAVDGHEQLRRLSVMVSWPKGRRENNLTIDTLLMSHEQE